jgi:hypothetical protein
MRSRSWAVLGRLAAIALRVSDKRPVLVREAELAERFSLSRGTLRNYRDAQALVRAVPDPKLRRELYRLSASGAAQLVRWLQRDADAAVTFLREHPSAGPRDIIAAEQRSLLSRGVRGWKRFGSLQEAVARMPAAPMPLPPDVMDAIKGHRLLRGSQNVSLMPALMAKPGNELAQFYRIDFLIPLVQRLYRTETIIETHEPIAEAAVLESPIFGSLDRYGSEAKSIWARAVTAASVYPLVGLVFPGPASRRRFVAALPSELTSGADQNKRKIGLQDALDSDLLLPASGMGHIFVTTRLNIVYDLNERKRP